MVDAEVGADDLGPVGQAGVREEVEGTGQPKVRVYADVVHGAVAVLIRGSGLDERFGVSGARSRHVDRAVARGVPADARGRIQSDWVRASGPLEPGPIERVGEHSLAVPKAGRMTVERDTDGAVRSSGAAGIEHDRSADLAADLLSGTLA